mgnify:FL=1
MAFAQIKPAKINLSLFGRLSFPKVEDQGRTVLLLGFDQDVVDVGLDGTHGKEELVSDLLVRFAQHNQTHDFGFAVGELVGVAIEGHLLFDVSIKIADVLFLGRLLHANRKHVIGIDDQQNRKVARKDVLAKVALGQVQLQPRGCQAHGNNKDVVEILGNDATDQNSADNQVLLLVVDTCLQLDLCALACRPKDI